MPKYKVTVNGRPYAITVPEGQNEKHATAYAMKAEAARIRSEGGQPQEKPRNKGSGIPALDKFLSTGNELILGGLQGMANMGSALTDAPAEALYGLIAGKDAQERVRQARLGGEKRADEALSRTFISHPNPGARELGKIGATTTIPVPPVVQGAGMLPALARGGVRAVQGALGGAATRKPGESAAMPAAIGAAANVALPPILSKLAQTRPAQAIGRGISKVAAPVMGAVDDASEAILSRVRPALRLPYAPLKGLPAPPVPSGPLAALDPRADERLATFRSAGIDNPTTGMVTRNPNVFSAEQNLSRLQGGEDLQRQILDVQKSLVEKGQQMAAGAKGAEATGQAVQDVLDTKRAEMQAVTSKLYRQVREAQGDVPVGRLQGFRELLDSPDVADDVTLDGFRQSIERRLARHTEHGGLTTVQQAEDLRKMIGRIGNNAEPSVRWARKTFIDALDDDVVSVLGDDAFKAARASSRAGFEEFKKTFAGKIADEKLAPEALTRRVLGAGTSLKDLRALKTTLHTGTPEQMAGQREAWQGLKVQAIDDLISGVSDDEGKLLGTTLTNRFQAQRDKFGVLLEPEDFKRLENLVKASRYATAAPPMSSVNYSGTELTRRNLDAMFAKVGPKVREGWAKWLAKNGAQHLAAGVISFPAANVALATGKGLAAGVGEARAANALARQVQMASNPQQAAAALQELDRMAQSSAAAREVLNRIGGMIGAGTAQQSAPVGAR